MTAGTSTVYEPSMLSFSLVFLSPSPVLEN